MTHKYHDSTKRKPIYRILKEGNIPATFKLPKEQRNSTKLTIHIGKTTRFGGPFVSLCGSDFWDKKERWSVASTDAFGRHHYPNITCQRCLRLLENIQAKDPKASIIELCKEKLDIRAYFSNKRETLKT